MRGFGSQESGVASPRLLVRWIVASVLGLLLASVDAGAQAVRVVTDRPSYNAGSEVRVEVVPMPDQSVSGPHLAASIRYAGETQPVASHIPLRAAAAHTSKTSAVYAPLWRIPPSARAGRYEIDLDGASGTDAASFVIYRKLVQVERIELGKTFYTSGDPVECAVIVKNLTAKPLKGLRVEFSDRYWPWIAGPADQAKSSIVPLSTNLALASGQAREIRSAHAGVAAVVKQPTVHQYGVVVWDHDRKNVLDIAFSKLTLIHPMGVDSPRPYPGQYAYPNLGAVHFDAYRHFYPPSLDSAAIEFDRSHTMFPAGGSAEISLALRNPTSKPWHGVSIGARLLAADGSEVAKQALAEPADLAPGGSPLNKSLAFKLPAAAGVYRVEVTAADASGNLLAASALELAANPLPKSIMVFCAHEDDEGGHAGMIRAAVENHIPIHFVYFTSGDAGACDRYYEHSCGPDEALNFGAIRMDETRAVLGHLGVPRDDIDFLGLPDGGSGKIWYDHVPESNPYVSVLLAGDHAPYEGLYRPNLAYARDTVVEAVKELIRKFQPEVIITAHPPAEGHIDHIVNNYFVVKALQELLRQGAVSPEVKVLVDRVYDPKTMPATPYHYAQHDFYVSGEAAALAQEAGWFYQSQGATSAEGYLHDFDKLRRSEPYREVLDWKEHEGWNDKP
ncbi:MAG TPA: PIG-L family deacetylase [Terriglobia bacterium]|nr:PIG-L family deacetylase [Terriglobia bacterium]